MVSDCACVQRFCTLLICFGPQLSLTLVYACKPHISYHVTVILSYIHITQLPHTQFSNTHTLTASEPKVTDFQPEVHATAGEQVTLRVNFTGVPKPTITWTFKGTKMEGDYATELGTDGSLLFVCVETKHAGRYNS